MSRGRKYSSDRSNVEKIRTKPKKGLGQFFLRDHTFIARIAEEIPQGCLVVEIGPGDGALTEELLNHGHRVLAVELDPDMIEKLEQDFKHRRDMTLISGNILNVNWGDLVSREDRIIIAGNLPYHLTSPILFNVFGYIREHQSTIELMIIMVQKEMAVRLTSDPGVKAYGGLTLLAGYHARTKYLFTVPSDAFFPQPRVDGGVIRLDFHQPNERPDVDYREFRRIVRGCFAQRRKMMKNALCVVGNLPAGWEELNYNFSLRPENFSLEDFVSLTKDLLRLESHQ